MLPGGVAPARVIVSCKINLWPDNRLMINSSSGVVKTTPAVPGAPCFRGRTLHCTGVVNETGGGGYKFKYMIMNLQEKTKICTAVGRVPYYSTNNNYL